MSNKTIKDFWENGQLKEERYYENDELKVVKTWYQSGKLQSETNYGGLNNDVYIEPPVSGLKSLVASVSGLQQSRKYNIEIKKPRNHQKNLQEGLERTWYENGQPKTERNYAIVLRDTYRRDIDMNEIKEKREVRHGLSREWYRNGQIAIEETNKWDTIDGISRYWDKNGKIWMENDYSKFWTEGSVSRQFDRFGNLIQEEVNGKNGKKSYQKCWNKNGEQRPCPNLMDPGYPDDLSKYLNDDSNFDKYRAKNISINESDFSKIQTGMKVKHARFGEGKVLTISGEGAGKEVEVFFSGGFVGDYELKKGLKKLLLKYAKLEILS